MEGEDEETENPRSFSGKPAWRKVIILAAGSVTNFVAGFLILVMIFAAAGGYAVPVIAGFMDGFPAQSDEGLLPGDRILSVDGHKVYVYADISTYFAASNGKTMDLVIERGGKTLIRNHFPLTLREYVVDGQTVQKYGLYFGTETATAGGVLKQSWNTCWYFTRAVWSGLKMLVTGQVSLNDMSGPVGIVSYVGQAGNQGQSAGGIWAGMQNVFYVIALIAVNLAIMNMLPIPALDGGRIFFLLINSGFYLLTRRRIAPKYEAYVHAAGFFLLILLMVVVTFNDVIKLVK